MKAVIVALIALIGIGCFGFGAFGTAYFKNYVIEDKQSMVLPDNSSLYLNQTYAKPFHLDFKQSCKIQLNLVVNYTTKENETLNLMIIPSVNYTYRYDKRPDNATFGLGSYFTNYTLQTPQPPSSKAVNKLLTIQSTDESRYVVDFMGGRQGATTNLTSIAGDYYVIIWVTNTTKIRDPDYLTFNLKIETTGRGENMRFWSYVVGAGCLITAGILAAIYLSKER